jgi:N-acetylmuramoyl-L-alanine amidase
MGKLKFLVIHCTATPEGREVTSDQIRHWHLDPPSAGRGWHQVGYTDLIHLNGGVERLVKNNEDGNVDPWEITNGAVGINSVSRHVVYAGGLTLDAKLAKDTRTPDQRKSLLAYVRDIIRSNPDVKVAGHNQFAKKACPSFNVPMWLEANLIPNKNIYKP